MARALVLFALTLVALVGPAAAAGPPVVTLTESGPVGFTYPAPSYAITVTVANHEATPVSGLVLSTNIAYWMLDGPVECPPEAVCTTSKVYLSTIAAGASVPYLFTYYPPLGYGPLHHAFTLTDASQNVVATIAHEVTVTLAPTLTDWQVSVTPAVGTGGLGARHRVSVTNLGPADAAGVVVNDRLDDGQTFTSASPSQGSCTSQLDTQIVVVCSVGSVPGHATVTVDVDTRLPPGPHFGGNSASVTTLTPVWDLRNLSAFADAVFHDRFWLCWICNSMLLQDDYKLTKFGFKVYADDTVRTTDGSVIRRDGLLIRGDCKVENAAGVISAPPVGAVAPCRGLASAPPSASAAAGNAEATVQWTPAVFDGGTPITGYTVTSVPNRASATVGPGSTSATLAGLVNGTSYTFTVSAQNLIGPGAAATSNAVTPATVPDAPTGVRVIAEDGSAVVSWSAPATDGGSALTGYSVKAMPGDVVASTANASTTSLRVPGLRNGTPYTFVVLAKNTLGTSAPSVSASGTPTAPPTRVTPAVRPAIRSFTPTKGKAGARVTIRGTSFRNVVSVLFNGKRAAFKVQSSTAILATVPARSTSGKITVKTRAGTAVTSSRFTILTVNKR